MYSQLLLLLQRTFFYGRFFFFRISLYKVTFNRRVSAKCTFFPASLIKIWYTRITLFFFFFLSATYAIWRCIHVQYVQCTRIIIIWEFCSDLWSGTLSQPIYIYIHRTYVIIIYIYKSFTSILRALNRMTWSSATAAVSSVPNTMYGQ